MYSHRSDNWREIDWWWGTYVDGRSLLLSEPDLWKIAPDREDDVWMDLDTWWESYTAQQRVHFRELRQVLARSNEEWERSDSRFDRDPLVADWSDTHTTTGPLRLTHEEDWSHWLAHLIRSSSGAFTMELFGDEFDETPASVRREVYLYDTERSDRRVDVLVLFRGRGISIEVKIGDTQYAKTPHTAALTERRNHREWTHYLLLPNSKKSVLRGTFGSQFVEEETARPVISSGESEDISIIYWEDVAQALRHTLLDDTESDPHWNASAYLFTTLIEQKILRFHPGRLMESHTDSGAVAVSEMGGSSSTDVEDQLIYLENVMRSTNHG